MHLETRDGSLYMYLVCLAKFGTFCEASLFRCKFGEGKEEDAGTSQCGKFMIFLSFKSYVKSILEDTKVLEVPYFAILGALNLLIW